MDCCGSSKPKDTDNEIKTGQTGIEKNTVEKEHNHGCCGGGGTKDMVLHIVLMIIVVLAISYFTRG